MTWTRYAWKAAVRAWPFRKGRGRLLDRARLSVTGTVVGRDRCGNRLLLDLDNLIDCLIFLQGSYEWDAIRRLAALARREGCTHFIDVGAHIGIYSLFFARQKTMTRLLAFEPDPRNFAQLMGNLFLNGLLQRLEVFNVALSSQDGSCTFYMHRPYARKVGAPNFNTGTSSLIPSQHLSPITVQARRLDGVAAISGERILMKIDVEGAESMVLSGASDLLSRNFCLVMVEIWDRPPGAVEKTVSFMNELGYERVAENLGADNYLFMNKAPRATAKP